MNYEPEPEDVEEAGQIVRMRSALSEFEVAQEEIAVLKVKLRGAEERIQIVLRSKDRWLERAQRAYRELNAITVAISHACEQAGITVAPTDLPNRLANLLTVLICERDLAREANGNLEARAIAAEQRAGEVEAVLRLRNERMADELRESGKLLKGE